MSWWFRLFGSDREVESNFKTYEFDCRDGTPYPREWTVTRLKPLIEGLEVIRTYFGDRVITITSGYRTPNYNKMVGGAKYSQHKEGRAADIKVKGISARRVAVGVRALMRAGKIPLGGIGSYASFTHYDIRGKRVFWRK